MWNFVERRPYFAVAALCLALFLPGFFTVPPIDRDEARFAQASKQMLESRDFVSIRFQDTARNKKPVGIYWLQAGAAALLESPPYNAIWAYRLPSLLGAVLAALLTLWAGTPLLGRRAALYAALILAATTALNFEARNAKTDAALLAAIVLAQGVLARAYMAPQNGKPLSRPLALLFWVAQGAGILLKGPIAPLITGLTVLTLGFSDRSWSWLKQLRPVTGVLALLLLVAPWAIAIGLATHGQFFAEAVGGDMATKLAGGQESHGAPPGAYFVLAILTFWPGTLFLLPALLKAWRDRAEPAFRFLLAWTVPAWLLFEGIPTKLPHYVLPIYPALALLCGAAIDAARKGDGKPFTRWPAGLAIVAFTGVALSLGLAQIALRSFAAVKPDFADTLICIALLSAAGMAAGFMSRQAPRAALGAAVIASFIACGATFGVLAPHLDRLWIAPRLVALLPRNVEGTRPPLLVSGYSEPSLVFLAGTATRFLPPEDAADALCSTCVAAIDDGGLPTFRARARERGLGLTELGRVAGFNYSVGKPITLTLLRTSP